MEDDLNKVYYDPENPFSFGSVDKLKQGVKNVSRQEIKTWLQSQPTYTIHKPRRIYIPRNKTYVTTANEVFQADLIDLRSLRRHNKGHKYILTVIDVLSKYAWSFPLKNKTSKEVLTAFKKVIKERKPLRLNVDQGSEFLSKVFKDYLKEEDIQLYTSVGQIKCAVIERFNRTLKDKMFKLFTKTKKFNYVNSLTKIMKAYNSTVHSSIGFAPKNVNIQNEHLVWQRLYGKQKPAKKPKLKVGDFVRLSKSKPLFEKGYKGYWTKEIFIVSKILYRNPVCYNVKDFNNEEIRGAFYEYELQKVAL